MGSQSMVTVLGLIVLFSIFNNFLNDKERLCADNTYGYAKYTAARDIARSAIHLALKNMEVDGIFPFSGNLDGGTYTVTGTAIADTLRMTSTANFSDTVYTISTTMWRYPKPFPGVGAALGLHIEDVEFDIKGASALIDGRNYDSTGTYLVGTGDVAGVTTIDPGDSADIAAEGANINGSSDVAIDSSLADPSLFADEYIASADYIYTVDPTKSVTTFAGNQIWGTAIAPKITYVNAGDSTNLAKFTGTIEGWGVLVIQGYVQFTGTFTYHGLVLVYGDNTLDFSLSTGTPTIIGSMLMGGAPGSSFEMRGNAAVKYSSDAIDDAKYIGKLLAYRIVDWYE